MHTTAARLRLDGATWRAEEVAHIERAERLTRGHRERSARGEKHPVEDFLFTYYSYKPSVLARWHPGAGVELADAADSARTSWRWYTVDRLSGAARVDEAAFRSERGVVIANIARILEATAGRPPQFGCFGLHEWAMVYRGDRPRHAVPLRLGHDGTDAVVEAHDLRCTHFDAYRFFTPDAAPRNREPLTRDLQPDREQGGCLHAGMDMYKWAVKLGPLVPGSVLLDSFELSHEIRELDMRASPYDLADWGYAPIAIETAEGKAEYVRQQRAFAERAGVLRSKLSRIAEG